MLSTQLILIINTCQQNFRLRYEQNSVSRSCSTRSIKVTDNANITGTTRPVTDPRHWLASRCPPYVTSTASVRSGALLNGYRATNDCTPRVYSFVRYYNVVSTAQTFLLVREQWIAARTLRLLYGITCEEQVYVPDIRRVHNEVAKKKLLASPCLSVSLSACMDSRTAEQTHQTGNWRDLLTSVDTFQFV
jgi:hypothetical protein